MSKLRSLFQLKAASQDFQIPSRNDTNFSGDIFASAGNRKLCLSASTLLLYHRSCYFMVQGGKRQSFILCFFNFCYYFPFKWICVNTIIPIFDANTGFLMNIDFHLFSWLSIHRGCDQYMPDTIHGLFNFLKVYLLTHLLVCGGMRSPQCVCVEARGQLIGVDSLPLSRDSSDQN